MSARRTISFGEFHLDPQARQLRHRGVICPLRSKSFAVLWYLANNPGRLVPHEELMRAVWPDTSVGTTVLRVSIREIRAALGSAANLLVTVPRQGHRFVFTLDNEVRARPFVGRHAELSMLHRALLRARTGSRQTVFVTGEAGVGKSRLVERFLDDVRAAGSARIITGQCIELHDGLEPYAPWIDLLGRACRASDGQNFESALARWAPSWLRQLSSHDEAGAGDRLLPMTGVAPTGGQLSRELSTLMEMLAEEGPLVIELHDLHWADASTLDALSHLGQRNVRAPLLIVCTRRLNAGVDAERLDHLQRQILGRDHGTELQLGALSADEVERFLAQRLAPVPLGNDVAATLHARTGGHPLFLTALTDHLLAQRQLVIDDQAWRIVGSLDGVIPTAIREMIATVFQSVAPDQRRILEAASVAGTAFSAAAIAAALSMPIAEVEDACDQLVAERRLEHGGIEEWPDGTTSARYSFLHHLHAEVLYAGLSPALRSRYHGLVGERVSSAHAGHLNEVAALLAHHFTLAGDEKRAWYAHRTAARAARNAFAAREAIGHLEAALTMVRALPQDDQRAHVELRCLLELGEAAIAVHGYASPTVAGIYPRACDLATSSDDVPLHVLAESGLLMHHAMRGELHAAQARAEEFVHLTERSPMLAGTGHASLGAILLSRGELRAAHQSFLRASECWERWPEVAPDLRAMVDAFRAISDLLLLSGHDARNDIARVLTRVGELPFDPLLVSQCEAIAAFFFAVRGSHEEARTAAARAIELADAHGLPLYLSPRVAHGWATRDAAAIRAEMALLAESEVRLGAPQNGALLAEVLLGAGDVAGAKAAVERAVADASEFGENYYLADLHRLRGRCRLVEARTAARGAQRSLLGEAQEWFELAIAEATRQSARLWVLRAATDALEAAPRAARARARLRDLLLEVDDGGDLPDVVRARHLLEEA
ncbi:AAA family ATPase [Candidatus Binatia bacterium]|nr:AAA family ATPase [Candidatus Binatia bacterium]